MIRRRDELLLDLIWLVPVVLATAAVLLTAHDGPVVLPLLAVALLPWVGHALGRHLPSWLFGLVAIAPVVAILVVDGLNASVFLGTTALSLLASRAGRLWTLALIAVIGTALPFASAISHPVDPGSIYFAIGDLFGIAVGVLLRHSRRLDAQLREADARLAAVAAQEARTQLARDVHDLVAHSLTVVVLQIGGARRVLRADPARAEAALEQAEQVCRESLDGVREVVGLLRSGDEGPGAAAMDLLRLVETYRAAGVDVELRADDRTTGLPLLVRGTVYRVVQEALANAARYRRAGSTVTVRTAVDADGVTLSVANPGPPGPRSTTGGYGLTGLREQVAAIGGTLSSGPVGDVWRVDCRLPRDVTAARVGVTVR